MTDPTVAALVVRLEALEARNADLEARTLTLEIENEELRRSGPSPQAPPVDPGAASATVGRRRLLTTGLAAAGAAAAGAVLLDGAPVAAADGETMLAGRSMSANRTTALSATGATPPNQGESAFAIRDNGSGRGTGLGAAGLDINAAGQRFSTGLNVSTRDMGIAMSSSLHGMFISCEGRALDIQSGDEGIQVAAVGRAIGGNSTGANETAVTATANTSTGLGLYAAGGNGIEAVSSKATGGVGVSATARNGTALVGTATVGAGVRGRGTTFGVIAQSTTANADEAALYASASAGTGVASVVDSGLAMRALSASGGGAHIDAPKFHLRLGNSENRGAPTGDAIAHQRGDLVESSGGDLWLCTGAGTPGTWRKLAGPATAGAFHVLASPARAYDTRPGFAPTTVGPKTPMPGGSTNRTIDLRTAGGVPAGATAATVAFLVVGAAAGSGNATIWAGGAARPVANTMVWGGTSGRASTLAVTALDPQGRCQVNTSIRTDVVIDVVGYYR